MSTMREALQRAPEVLQKLMMDDNDLSDIGAAFGMTGDGSEPLWADEAEAVPSAAAGGDEPVVSARRSRPKLTEDVILNRLPPLLEGMKQMSDALESGGPARMQPRAFLRMYADFVSQWSKETFPSMPRDDFLKRVHAMGSRPVLRERVRDLFYSRAGAQASGALDVSPAGSGGVAPRDEETLGPVVVTPVGRPDPAPGASSGPTEDDLAELYAMEAEVARARAMDHDEDEYEALMEATRDAQPQASSPRPSSHEPFQSPLSVSVTQGEVLDAPRISLAERVRRNRQAAAASSSGGSTASVACTPTTPLPLPRAIPRPSVIPPSAPTPPEPEDADLFLAAAQPRGPDGDTATARATPHASPTSSSSPATPDNASLTPVTRTTPRSTPRVAPHLPLPTASQRKKRKPTPPTTTTTTHSSPGSSNATAVETTKKTPRAPALPLPNPRLVKRSRTSAAARNDTTMAASSTPSNDGAPSVPVPSLPLPSTSSQ